MKKILALILLQTAGAWAGEVNLAICHRPQVCPPIGPEELASIVTKQGNTFNGLSQLVQLLGNGKLPALDGANLFNLSTGTGGGTPAGANTEVQYNNSGVFGASPDLTFDQGITQLSATKFKTTRIDTPTGSLLLDADTFLDLRSDGGSGFIRLRAGAGSTIDMLSPQNTVTHALTIINDGATPFIGIRNFTPVYALDINGDVRSTASVIAATFNAVGSAYQMNGYTYLGKDLNLHVSSGIFSGLITAPALTVESPIDTPSIVCGTVDGPITLETDTDGGRITSTGPLFLKADGVEAVHFQAGEVRFTNLNVYFDNDIRSPDTLNIATDSGDLNLSPNSGLVGINNSSPNYGLDVSGSINTDQIYLSGGSNLISGNQGEIQFNGGDVSNLKSDPNLIWDDTNNFLGVGTNTPAYTLDVAGDVNTSGVYRKDGNPIFTGTANQLAYFSDANTITSSALLSFDGSTLGITSDGFFKDTAANNGFSTDGTLASLFASGGAFVNVRQDNGNVNIQDAFGSNITLDNTGTITLAVPDVTVTIDGSVQAELATTAGSFVQVRQDDGTVNIGDPIGSTIILDNTGNINITATITNVIGSLVVSSNTHVGYSQVSNNAGTGQTSTSVSCGAGTVVTGGGCQCDDDTATFSQHFPFSSTQWNCQSPTPCTGNLIAYAICARLGTQ